ncbi:anti-sigma factor [Paenarthrobacter sp. DKR-5]|uniref:anti-sigma factor n=1 Tax=Paenarthrobacter sp. DKR-5 TaxID=2835535 RepID=UPI001BDD773A|nr:anti-sigma factor [Paenarthrobacter sp. DKR-5]MBT1002979.1 anti-sigma factor [Paenarthrobacter sp. DKR-5]
MSENNANAMHFSEDLATDLDRGLILEWAEIYALDALTEDERAAIDAFLASGPAQTRQLFTERVRAAREVLASGYAMDEAEPPADLFDRITASLPQTALPATDLSGAPEPATAPGSPAPAPVADLAARRAGKARGGASGTRRWLVAAAAAAVLVVGGTAVGVTLANQQQSPQEQVLHASDVKTETVSIPGGGTATISLSRSRDAAVVAMKNVPAPKAGTVYQMWLIPTNGQNPASAGTMDADTLSKPATVKGINAATAVAITVEPAPGSQKPTTAPISVVQLKS